jgi:AcrR family transcriptional regulator
MLRCSIVGKKSAQVPVDEDLREITSQSLQERKQQVVRDAIWDAATDLFAERGFDQTTVDDIARKAGVSRRSFFRYFSSKSDLMGYGVTGYGTYLTDAIARCPTEYRLPAIFRQTVFQVARQCAAHPRTRKIMEIAAKYPAASEALQSRTMELQNGLEAAFARRSLQSAKDASEPRVVAALTLSILSVIFRVWFEQGQRDISATAEQVLGTLGHLVRHDPKNSAKLIS